MSTLPHSMDDLATMTGDLIAPDSVDYDDARTIYNLMHDRRPAAGGPRQRALHRRLQWL